MKPIVKVDRISSVEEALFLQQLGVDIINFSLVSDYRFNDCRYVSENVILEISNFLRDSYLCCTLESVDGYLDLIRNYKFDFIQCREHTSLNSQSREALEAAKIRIIYSGIQACHDDDPGWIISPWEDRLTISNHLFHIDILPDVCDSWNFLKEESPKYEECLQIEDLNEISHEFQLIISVDFQPSNIKDILEHLPSIYGISFTLGESPIRDDFHWVSYPDLITILNVLNDND